jgi:hypothetical protein
MTLVSAANLMLSLLTVIGQLVIGFVVVSFVIGSGKLIRWLGQRAILFSFIIALTATLGSLFYSEVAGYEPCELCWFERIFMYPQVILLGIALSKKNGISTIYNSIALSAIGALIAGYHHLLQIGVAPELPCSAAGYSAGCSQRFVMDFGYITIPMMALTAFVLILLSMFTMKIYEGANTKI